MGLAACAVVGDAQMATCVAVESGRWQRRKSQEVFGVSLTKGGNKEMGRQSLLHLVFPGGLPFKS